MDNKVYTNVEGLTWHYNFEKDTTVYLLNVNCTTTLRYGTIGKFKMAENTFIEASIEDGKEPLLLVFCREDNYFVTRDIHFRDDYYDIGFSLEALGIRCKIKKEAILPSLDSSPLEENKELIVGPFGYSLCCKYQMIWDKWYYFETQSLKAFIGNEEFKLFSFEWRSDIPVKTKTKELAKKMIAGKKVTLNNLRKILVVDENELDTQMQNECELKTSEFSLNTYHNNVIYQDSIGKVPISNELIGISDFFIIKIFNAGMEKKSREVIDEFFTPIG